MRRISGPTVIVSGVLSLLAVLLLVGHGPWAGPRLVRLTGSHGLNVGDVPVLAAWGVGIAALARRDRPKP